MKLKNSKKAGKQMPWLNNLAEKKTFTFYAKIARGWPD